ncbi:hypothetical protein ANCDUO_09530 [Ancylostoma duodenale]|uniref:Major facilitator superfamily (MFS) profile domain-containing protein n=1 Tax=Ancylostoma duodenale TaxID=51022 RepID=A0A0C2GGC6_9BILA|nr:hypothetical protein ANCDUO_09530 [Ancylostoma duodenale]
MGGVKEVKKPLTPHHLDDIVVLGRYTFLVCLLTELAFLSQLSNTMYMVYAVRRNKSQLKGKHMRDTYGNRRKPTRDAAIGSKRAARIWAPIAGASPPIRGCGNITFNSTEEACANIHLCEGAPLQLESQFYSVNEEWDIHCENRYLERRSTSLQMLGVMIGSLSSGQISSSFGRKKPLVICLAMTGILSLATYFVTDLIQFTAIRFVLGIFTGGHSTYLHESPRWLVHRGKIREARRVILDIAHIDGDKANIDERNLDKILQLEHDVKFCTAHEEGISS